MTLEEFEQITMNKLLEGEDTNLEILRNQYSMATVINRELTGVGFYVSFQRNEKVAKVKGKQKFHIGDIRIELDGVLSGVGCVLFINDGYIDYLEGYTFDDPWPIEINLLNISFDTGEKRNLEKLKTIWNLD